MKGLYHVEQMVLSSCSSMCDGVCFMPFVPCHFFPSSACSTTAFLPIPSIRTCAFPLVANGSCSSSSFVSFSAIPVVLSAQGCVSWRIDALFMLACVHTRCHHQQTLGCGPSMDRRWTVGMTAWTVLDVERSYRRSFGKGERRRVT